MALGCAPKLGGWGAGAGKSDGAAEPKAGALGWLEPWPKEGVCPRPKDEAAGGAGDAVAEEKTNGELD